MLTANLECILGNLILRRKKIDGTVFSSGSVYLLITFQIEGSVIPPRQPLPPLLSLQWPDHPTASDPPHPAGRAGTPLMDLTSSAEINSACGKVLPLAKRLVWWTRSHQRYSSPAASSSTLVTAMARSSSCCWSTTSGQFIIRSEAFWTLGKAMTSRMEAAPVISITNRSRP